MVGVITTGEQICAAKAGSNRRATRPPWGPRREDSLLSRESGFGREAPPLGLRRDDRAEAKRLRGELVGCRSTPPPGLLRRAPGEDGGKRSRAAQGRAVGRARADEEVGSTRPVGAFSGFARVFRRARWHRWRRSH
jgi:hypothetical protein